MIRQYFRPLLNVALLASMSLAGCAEDIVMTPSPTGLVQAVFDPSASPPRVPTPTDLVMDRTTGLLKVPVADANKPAQAYLDAYLNTLDGYPTSAAAEIAFDGLLDDKTVSDKTFVVVDITSATSPTRVTGLLHDYVKNADGSTSKVRIFNPAGWKRAAHYAVFMTSGIKDTGAKSVIRSALFELAAGVRPLCAWDKTKAMSAATGQCQPPAAGSEATGCCTFNYSALVESAVKTKIRDADANKGKDLEEVEKLVRAEILASATRFEMMRQGYSNLFTIAKVMGINRDEIVLLFNFHTVGMNEAVFNPAASPPAIPTPSSLVRSPTTGLLNVPTSLTASAAEKAFNAYLNTLDGFPAGSTGSISFTGDLDSASVAGGVLVYEVGGTSAAPTLTQVTAAAPTHDAANRKITITAQGGFKRGATYLMATVGGTAGLKNKGAAKAVSPVRSAMMHLVLSDAALCTWDKTKSMDSAGKCSDPAAGATATGCCTDAPVSSFVDDPKSKTGGLTAIAKASTFEVIRQAYDPLVKLVMTSASITDRLSISALWTFTVTSQTEILYDPTTGQIPFPNNLLYDATSGKVNIPASPGETAREKALREGLNTLDGFTTQGTSFAAYAGKLDKTTFKTGNVLTLNTSTNTTVDMIYAVDDKSGAITIQPKAPLDEKTTYAVVVLSRPTAGSAAAASGLQDDKKRYVVPSTFMALLRGKDPVYDTVAKKSLVSSLGDATAETIEKARLSHKALFDSLETNLKISRTDVAAAWTFTTQSITAALAGLRALPYSALPATDSNKPLFTGALDTTLTGFPTTKVPSGNLGGWVPAGTFQTWMALDESGQGTLLADPTKGTPATVKFWMTIPKGTMPAAGWPVVVFQHGLGSFKGAMLPVVNTLATPVTAAGHPGFATIGFDIVYHGERSWCTKDTHCAGSGATCTLTTGACSSGGLADTDADGNPDASSARFLNTDNPFAIRDNMRQHVIDAASLFRAIRLGAAGGITPAASVALDATKVHYVGMSLGAILGTLVLATSDLPGRAVLNVPGAPFVDIAFTSAAFKTIIDDLLKAMNIKRDTLDYLKTVTTFHMIIDPACPGNFADYLVNSQLDDKVKTGSKIPNKTVMVQLAGKDAVIPTALGQDLATWIGVTTTDSTYPQQGHSFLLVPDTSAGMPPKATEAAQAQMLDFLLTGKVCTPDTTAGTCS